MTDVEWLELCRLEDRRAIALTSTWSEADEARYQELKRKHEIEMDWARHWAEEAAENRHGDFDPL